MSALEPDPADGARAPGPDPDAAAPTGVDPIEDVETSSRRAGDHGGRRASWLTFLRDLALVVIIAIVVSFVLKTYVVRTFYIPSSSMEDTLQIDDRILVNELVPNVFGVERGDIVVFRDPGGWLTPMPQPERNWIETAFDWLGSLVGLTASDSNDHLVKRVIGVGGDTVSCCTAGGALTVNGIPLDEPYIKVPAGADAAPSEFEVVVPEGSLWLMGDNRYNSRDSLWHIDDPNGGFVPLADVVGRAFVISWPVSRWAVLGNSPTTFEGVGEAGTTGP